MPDKWGRTTGQDFMGLAYMMREFGQIGDKQQVGAGVDALMQNPNAAKPEDVSGYNWTRAQQQYGAGLEGIGRGRDALFEQEVRGTEEQMLGEAEKAGSVGQYLESFVPRTRQELHAATRLYEMADGQAGMRKSLFERRLAVGAQQGRQLMQSVREARSLMDAGERDKAGLLLEGASNQALSRWRYKYDPETGRLDRLHLSRDKGWTPVGDSLDVSEALKQAEGMTIRDYALGVAGEMASTSEFNRKEIESGGRRAVDANGREFRVYPQINLQGFGGRDYLVYDSGNQLVGRFDEEGFPQSGLRFEQQKPREKPPKELDWGKVGLQAQKIYNDSLKAALGDNMVPSPEEHAQAEAEARRMADQWLAVTVGPGVSMDTLAQSRWGSSASSASPAGGSSTGRPGSAGDSLGLRGYEDIQQPGTETRGGGTPSGFNTAAEVEAAMKAGRVRPGDIVIVNGQKYRVAE